MRWGLDSRYKRKEADDIPEKLVPMQSEEKILRFVQIYLYSLEPAATGSGLYMISGKTESLCVPKDGASLNCESLKLVDQFVYKSSNISSIENEEEISDNAGEEKRTPNQRFPMDTYAWTHQHKLSFSSSARILDALMRTYHESKISMLSVYLDDDDNNSRDMLSS